MWHACIPEVDTIPLKITLAFQGPQFDSATPVTKVAAD